MRTETDVVVVGGGATGCGVARDLAMRGLDVTLVERGQLNAGTTGRTHGVLHSGARYADADPESAAACRTEGRTLRRIAGAAIADTGGYFLQLREDDDAYFERKLAACRACGIHASTRSAEAVASTEPGLTGDVVRAIEVPDAVVSPSRLVAATAASAVDHGATIRTGTTVTGIEIEDGVTVEVRKRAHQSEPGAAGSIAAGHLVNAAGAWAGRVASLAGLDLRMAPTAGLMVTLRYDGLGTLLNRCRPPDDGDVVVPHAGAVVCGTTSVPIDDPEDWDPGADDAATEAVVAEAQAMLPALSEAPRVRSFWGIRPLYDPGGRDATRGFRVMDHAERDGVPDVTTVVGGKLTTYRLMAEATADLVAERLGVDEPCRTADEPLPGHDEPGRMDALVESLDARGPADGPLLEGGSN